MGNNTNESHIRDVRRAIDAWSESRGLGRREEHRELAEAICKAIGHRFNPPIAKKGLLLDMDEHGDYCNPRVVDWDGAEETLYPVDPVTDEPVTEAAAHCALPLPHADSIPDI